MKKNTNEMFFQLVALLLAVILGGRWLASRWRIGA